MPFRNHYFKAALNSPLTSLLGEVMQNKCPLTCHQDPHWMHYARSSSRKEEPPNLAIATCDGKEALLDCTPPAPGFGTTRLPSPFMSAIILRGRSVRAMKLITTPSALRAQTDRIRNEINPSTAAAVAAANPVVLRFIQIRFLKRPPWRNAAISTDSGSHLAGCRRFVASLLSASTLSVLCTQEGSAVLEIFLNFFLWLLENFLLRSSLLNQIFICPENHWFMLQALINKLSFAFSS